jgi:hypothetical protein
MSISVCIDLLHPLSLVCVDSILSSTSVLFVIASSSFSRAPYLHAPDSFALGPVLSLRAGGYLSVSPSSLHHHSLSLNFN